MSVIAQKIVNSRTGDFYYPEDNKLFEYLYDAYCKLERPNDSFGAVVAEAKSAGDNSSDKFIAARQALISWYADKYYPQDKKNARQGSEGCKPTDLDNPKKKKTNRGIQRVVLQRNIEEGTYRFDEPVKPELFEVYLNDFPISGHPFQTQDARAFILHTAVAFLLSPEQLDYLLVTFGFHPLHVRHIHDMAIYVVLQDAAQNWMTEERRIRNPFHEVWEVYEAARLLLIQAPNVELREPLEDEQVAFQSDSTRVVQQYILGQKLSKENLLAYVGSHTEFYNLRHRRLLAEHKRLVDLFSSLYIHRWNWEENDKKYSLYKFLVAFCKVFEDRRLNDHIYWYVVKRGCHPTREFMIVLWIHAYCFLFYPEVLTPYDLSKIIPFKSKTQDPGLPLEQPFPEYFDKKHSCLRVLEYLSDTRYRASPLNGFYDGMTIRRTFSGSELIAFINNKLADYSWCKLDGRNAFDRNILNLSPLEVIMNSDGNIYKAFYNHEPIDNVQTMNVDNVPGPLVVVFKLLQEIKAIGSQSTKGSGGVWMPLSCDMCELI